MKRIASFLGTLSAYFLAIPAVAYAADSGQVIACPDNQFKVVCNLQAGDFADLFGKVIVFVFIVAIIIALGFLVYGGIRWITSGGDKGAVDTARNTIIAAVIGLILVFLSYFILNLVVYFFTGRSLTQLRLPTLQ
jgi:hypothetical protein